MKSLSRVGVGLSVIFGCLLLALFAELYYLLCRKKNKKKRIETRSNFPSIQQQDDGVDLDTDKEFLFKTVVDGPVAELYKLPRSPRFLFTIVEETREDLESDDGKGGEREKRSLSDFLSAVDVASPPLFTPPVTPNGIGSDPSAFESGRDAEFNKMRCSPPPKFKFLQDAEEKLRKKLLEGEVVRSRGILVGQNTVPCPSPLDEPVIPAFP